MLFRQGKIKGFEDLCQTSRKYSAIYIMTHIAKFQSTFIEMSDFLSKVVTNNAFREAILEFSSTCKVNPKKIVMVFVENVYGGPYRDEICRKNADLAFFRQRDLSDEFGVLSNIRELNDEDLRLVVGFLRILCILCAKMLTTGEI